MKRLACPALIDARTIVSEKAAHGSIARGDVTASGGSARVARLLFTLTLLGLCLSARPAHAYAWMIRHGFAECGGCHVDPMGGETLTGMGRVIGQTRLASPWGVEGPTDVAKFAFGVTEPDDVRLGGSFRALAVDYLEAWRGVAFPMQADVYGAGFIGRFTVALSVGVSRASARYEHASKARLLGDVEDEGLLLVSRNHWLGYRVSDAVMLRAGRINLPFGIRVPEHTLWVRSETETDRESDQQHGLSVVYAAGRVRSELMLSLGNYQLPDDDLRQRGYSGYLEYLLEPRLALGVSSFMLRAGRERNVDRGAYLRQGHGLTLRYAPWAPLVVLAEFDAIKHTGASLGYVGMANLDLEFIRGLHFAATGECLDRGRQPDGASAGDGQARFGGWLTANWFFFPHFDVRVDLVFRDDRSNTLLSQLHFYL
jgi:hypothetical protein